jgi:ATP-dependent DNA helicase RecQ
MNSNSQKALDALQTHFGYSSFRSPQDKIVETLIEGQSTLVLMPTGGGKSVCYQIPAIVRDGLTIVVCPLIALMKDQVDALIRNGVKAASMNSSQKDKSNQKEIIKQVENDEIDLLYVAPEKLLEPNFYKWLKTINIGMFAIDEAHCMSQWGHDFRPDYMKLSVLVTDFPNVPKIALTATANELTRQEIINRLSLQNSPQFICGFDRPNITYNIQPKIDEESQLLDYLKTNHTNEAGVVYCLSRKKTESIAELLRKNGFNALPYHARLSEKTKDETLEKFLSEDNLIVVATIAFGMGIDKPDVRFVCHVDLPNSVEAYYQETGRAGRDGLPSVAWMLYGMRDVVMRQKMVDDSEADDQHKRVKQNALNAIFSLCEVTQCRRQVLVEYFGDVMPKPCGNCDNCLNPPETFDASIAVQKALSVIVRTDQIFGATYLIDVLLGNSNPKIEKKGHDKLKVYGLGTEHSESEWKTIYKQLIVLGHVSADPKYGSLKLTEKCRAILRGEEKIHLGKQIINKEKIKRKKVNSNARDDFSMEDEFLFQSLRDLRSKIAKSKRTPPFMVFNDAALTSMVLVKPKVLSDMLKVSGIGQTKLDTYGQEFLDTILSIT